MKVDLITTSRELESIILSEYPEKICPEKQYKIYKERGIKTFHFSDLSYNQLSGFLENYPSYEYEIIDSKTKEIIERIDMIDFATLN